MPGPVRSFNAFVCYSHEDNQEDGRRWAQWLQEQLETYGIPPDLIGKLNDRGEKIPPSLYPVFRDRLELRASAQGAHEISEALKNSRALIILCSPRSAQKEWVRKEIADWQHAKRDDYIFPVLIDGDPTRDAFPPELDPKIVIAADLRPGGRPEQGCTTAAAYRARLKADDVYVEREIERRVKEFEERLSSELRRLIAGLLDISPGLLEARDALHRARLAEERAREEESRRIQIEQARDDALSARGEAEEARIEADRLRKDAEKSRDQAVRSTNRYFWSLVISGALGIVALGGLGLGWWQTKNAAIKQKQLAVERDKRLKSDATAKQRAAADEIRIRDEQIIRLKAEAKSAVNTALSLVDALLQKHLPQDALAHLAITCRRYPDQALAATRLFSLLSNAHWALPVTPPIHLPEQDYRKAAPIERARFSPNGRYIVTARYSESSGKAEIWNTQKQQLVARDIPFNSRGVNPDGSGCHLDEMSFSSDSRLFASVMSVPDPKETTILTLVNLATGRNRYVTMSPASLARCASRPMGKSLLQAWKTGA